MQQILWANEEFKTELVEELRRKQVRILGESGETFLVESNASDFVWAEALGQKAEVHDFESISQARSILRARGKLWTPFSSTHFRRSELILQDLLTPKRKPRKFLEALPKGPLGAFALVDENRLWLTPHLTPAVPPQAWDFEESKEAPSRAYLKLWELFTREGFYPRKGERCIELGSAPGGWTWVLAKLGCQVIAVDKGEMDPKILALPGVQWLRQDAFSVVPRPADWLFSDLICYPDRLLPLIKEWADKGPVRNFVCTVKFQGKTDFEALDALLRLPGSKALHLRHNKHEVTWVWRQDS